MSNRLNLTPIARIRAEYESHLPSLDNALRAFPWADIECYAQWLAQTHAYVAHTTRLTVLSAARLPTSHDELHVHMLAHAAEEKFHDRLLVDDLAAIGRKLVDYPPFSVTKAFYQSLYYQLDHLTPWALFGRVIPLEGVAARLGGDLASTVKRTFGNDAATFLDAHADADPGHVERAFAVVADVSAEEAEIIADGIRMTFDLYEAILATILRQR